MFSSDPDAKELNRLSYEKYKNIIFEISYGIFVSTVFTLRSCVPQKRIAKSASPGPDVSFPILGSWKFRHE